MENMVPDIPRIYTALAEWAACFVFVLLLKKRAPKWKTAVISAAALFIQIIFMEVTGSVKIYFWLPCMIIAIALMIGYIYGCCEVYWLDAAICHSRIFRFFRMADCLFFLSRRRTYACGIKMGDTFYSVGLGEWDDVEDFAFTSGRGWPLRYQLSGILFCTDDWCRGVCH